MLELSLLLATTEGALVRTLGLIERRGFALSAITTHTSAQGQHVNISLPANGRPADVLLRQVRRLADVRAASLDVPRPAFVLPAERTTASTPASGASAINRRGLSFFGIPERVSTSQAGYA